MLHTQTNKQTKKHEVRQSMFSCILIATIP